MEQGLVGCWFAEVVAISYWMMRVARRWPLICWSNDIEGCQGFGGEGACAICVIIFFLFC